MEDALIIAIDGPAAGGKGTIALELAERLGYLYVDTGAMYRAVAWEAIRQGLSLDDEKAIGRLAQTLEIRFERHVVDDKVSYKIFADNKDVTSDIRRPEVDQAASIVAQYPEVRQALLEKQRLLARPGGVVMEGRDITTVVLPHAHVKLFVTASLEERARRRYEQRLQTGQSADLVQIEAELAERDRRDSEREIAPMRIPEDATVIDTTGLDIETSVNVILRLISNRYAGSNAEKIADKQA